MSNGKNPLMLMMALSVPGAAHALGLGDIHVDSGINERLAAEIDIVGATPLDLTDLRAAVANRETFLRYGADRPAFLSSATFKVTQDSQGRPVLTVRSSESFTEPVVNFLVDLHWSHGEMVRQYTLLLDPAGFVSALPAPLASNVPAAPRIPATPPVATPIVETKTQTVARQVDPPTDQPDPMDGERTVRKTTHIKVGAKATLRGVAWRVGERSEPDLRRMMIAIFRANPNAFDGNINRLHRGAVLTIPSHAEASAISKTEAKREVHAQMAAWRAPARAVAAGGAMAATPVPAASVPTAAVVGAPPQAAVSGNAIDKASDSAGTEALGRRVRSMEQELSEMKGLLEREGDQLLEMQQRASRAAKPVPVASPQTVSAPHLQPKQVQPKPGYGTLVPIVAGMGLLAAALAALYVRVRRRVPTLKASNGHRAAGAADAAVADAVAADAVTADGMADALLDGTQSQRQEPPQKRVQRSAPTYASDNTEAHAGARAAADAIDPTHPMLPVLAAEQAGRSEIATGALSRAEQQEPTVNLHVETVNLRMDPTRLDYDFLDLDMTAQHVHMPSVLNEHAVVKERRTNLADVLKLAIEREPDRHDLRMKLLELYYSAAATNRKAFLEVVQKFARDRDYLQADQWDKIAYMGRQIASDNPLFIEERAADEDLADCA
jgi:pilus assembly protein FimV